ncbi:MAG: hypothetical protein DDT25_01201 [Chloroflexi bacterium]|nr:hypothetical protein [Chloroflexota bacterium]
MVPSGKTTSIKSPGSIFSGAAKRMVYSPISPAVRGTTVTTAVTGVALTGASITAHRLATRARMVSRLSIRRFVFMFLNAPRERYATEQPLPSYPMLCKALFSVFTYSTGSNPPL